MASKQGQDRRKEKHSILLDTGCSNSSVTTQIKRFLTNILPTKVKMFTANQGESMVEEKGKLNLKGVKIEALYMSKIFKKHSYPTQT